MFTEEEWRERLHSHDKTTFVAIDESDAEEFWVGTLTVLHPEMNIPPYSPGVPSVAMDADSEVHYLVGMWVHPFHRRKGVGRGLVEAAVRGVQERSAATGGSKSMKQVIALQVRVDNEAAIALYKALGFAEATAFEKRGDSGLQIPMLMRVA